jgi:hypothetical protein
MRVVAKKSLLNFILLTSRIDIDKIAALIYGIFNYPYKYSEYYILKDPFFDKKNLKLIMVTQLLIAFFISIFLYFFLSVSDDDYYTNSNSIYVSENPVQVDLRSLSRYTELLLSKYGKKTVLALETSVNNLISLHTDDGEVFFADKNYGLIVKGDITKINDKSSLNQESKALVYFSSDKAAPVNYASTAPKTPDLDVNSKYKELMRKHIDEISNADVPNVNTSNSSNEQNFIVSSTPLASPVSSSIASNVSMPAKSHIDDDSCLIKFGGFDQPKVGYDKDCNPLSPEAKKEQIQTLVGGFPEGFFIKHKSETERAEIYVFTDYTCGYCQKLHKQIDTFLKNGISVNYVFYPRAVGMRNESAAKEVVTNMTSAWCSADQVAAIDQLYKTKYVPYAECEKNDTKLDSPVRQHYILGMMFDIQGTPLIVGSNGETSYGFRSVGITLSNLKL